MIRDATENDMDSVAEIYNYYIRNTVATFEEVELPMVEVLRRFQKIKNIGYPWLVAESGGNVIGYAYATKWHERSAYRYSAEVTVYVSHSYTTNGWGTRLYDVLFSRLRNMNIHVLIAGITLPNDASVALHEKYGMEKAAHYKEVGLKFGKWLDVGYWQTLVKRENDIN